MKRSRVAQRASLFCCAALSVAFAACGASDDHIDITHSPCEPLVLRAADATPDELASIAEAVAMWNRLGTHLALFDGGANDPRVPVVAVHFEEGAPMFHGVYRDEVGDLVINRSIAQSEVRAIVLAHEIGHAFGLGHIDRRTSVMNRGNLETPPIEADALALGRTWPGCSLAPAE